MFDNDKLSPFTQWVLFETDLVPASLLVLAFAMVGLGLFALYKLTGRKRELILLAAALPTTAIAFRLGLLSENVTRAAFYVMFLMAAVIAFLPAAKRDRVQN